MLVLLPFLRAKSFASRRRLALSERLWYKTEWSLRFVGNTKMMLPHDASSSLSVEGTTRKVQLPFCESKMYERIRMTMTNNESVIVWEEKKIQT
jgi:hypothetical protein